MSCNRTMAGISTVTVAERHTAGESEVTMGSARPASIRTTARRSLTSWSGSKVAFKRRTLPIGDLSSDPLTRSPTRGLDHFFGSRRDFPVTGRGHDAKGPVVARREGNERCVVPPASTAQPPTSAREGKDRQWTSHEVLREVNRRGPHDRSARQATMAAPRRGPSAPSGDRHNSTCEE